MIFGRMLTSGSAFARQLGTGAKAFGRALTNDANKVAAGIGKAQRTISTLERSAGGIPIVGSGLKTIGSVLQGARDVASLTSTGGQALTNVARGDFQGLKGNYQSAKGTLGDLANSGKSAMASGSATIAGAGAFL